MKTRTLGRSDLETPVIVLGTWAYGGWFWGPSDDGPAIRAVHRALDLGMTAIDTAPVYGVGYSEEVVGRALRGRRDRAIVMTKCGLVWDTDEGEFDFELVMEGAPGYVIRRNLRPRSVRRECEQSLRRLGTDRIDLLQCHWPDPVTPIPDTMGEMVKLHREGKIRAVGVSNFTPSMMDQAREALGGVPLASNQPKYSLLSRGIEADIVPYAREHGIGLIAYSPLEMGLLTGKVTEDRTFPEGDHRSSLGKFLPENRSRVNAVLEEHVVPVADRHGATPAQVALAWVRQRPGITAAIAGARNPGQVEENAGAGELELEPGEMDALTRAFEAAALVKPGP